MSQPIVVTCCRLQAREKRVNKSRLVLILLLIGWKSGVSFVGQSESDEMENQSKRNYHSTLK